MATTYLIPVDHLPLTISLRYLGVPDGFVDQIDGVLQPMADAGYARNDNPVTKPVSVDPVHGMDRWPFWTRPAVTASSGPTARFAA